MKEAVACLFFPEERYPDRENGGTRGI